MATYKIILTIKDNYGKEKEVEGGVVNIDLTNLSTAEVNNIVDALQLDDYATDIELESAIKGLPGFEPSTDSIKYNSFNTPTEEAE